MEDGDEYMKCLDGFLRWLCMGSSPLKEDTKNANKIIQTHVRYFTCKNFRRGLQSFDTMVRDLNWNHIN